MTGNFLAGARCFRRGLQLCGHSQLRVYVAAPIAAAVVLFGLLLNWGADAFQRLLNALVGWLPDWLDWLHWLLWPVAIIIAVFFLVYGFVFLCNLIAAPFNGLLAERAETLLRGSTPEPVPWLDILRDLPGAVFNELRKLGYFLCFALPLLLLTVIPGPNLLAGPLWLLLGSWMLALEYLDYPMGNHRFAFPDVRRHARSHRSSALGFGSLALLASSIPLLNLLVMPAAVIGATALFIETGQQPHPGEPNAGEN